MKILGDSRTSIDLHECEELHAQYLDACASYHDDLLLIRQNNGVTSHRSSNFFSVATVNPAIMNQSATTTSNNDLTAKNLFASKAAHHRQSGIKRGKDFPTELVNNTIPLLVYQTVGSAATTAPISAAAVLSESSLSGGLAHLSHSASSKSAPAETRTALLSPQLRPGQYVWYILKSK